MNINGVGISQAAAVDISKLKTPSGMQAATKPEERATPEASELEKGIFDNGDISQIEIKKYVRKDFTDPMTGEVTKAYDEHGNRTWGGGSNVRAAIVKIENQLMNKHLDAFNRFSEGMERLEKSNPDLLDKVWSFSINENNEIEIKDTLNKLTSTDMEVLKKELNKINHDGLLSELADAVVMKMEFGRDYGLGNQTAYNVNRENLSDVLDFREFLSSDTKGYFGNRLDTQLSRQGEDFIVKNDPWKLVANVVDGKLNIVDEQI